MIPQQIGDVKLRHAGLTRAEHLARTAHLQVAPRDLEPIAGLAHRREPRPRHLRQRRLIQQHAVAFGLAAADAPAQLMQLRKPQSLGVFDDHERGVRHVHAHFDDGGGDQQVDVAAFERGHDFFLFQRLHASVDQRHLEFRQRFVQRLRGIRRRLQLKRLRLLDQRADPVGLAPGGAGVANAADDIGTACGRDRHGLDRFAPRRQLVDHRHVEVGIQALGEGARDRGGRHDQLMRTAIAAAPLLAQRQALMHAEAVLLIDDDESQIGKFDVCLKQRLGADGDGGLPRSDFFERVLARAAVELAGESGHDNTERLEPAGKVAQVLIGEQLGRRHHRHLQTAFDGGETRARGHDGLARPDIALHQALHRMYLSQIGQDFIQHSLLRARELKRQTREQLRYQFSRPAHGRRAFGLHSRAQTLQTQVMRQQLFKGKAQHRGMFALRQQLHRRVRRWLMHQRQRFDQRGQAQLLQHGGRQLFLDFFQIFFQRLAREFAQTQLMHAGGRRIHRRQVLLRLGRLSAVGEFVLGVNHLETRGTEADLAEQAQTAAARKVRLLRGAEIKKPQMQMAGAVAHAADQAAPAAEHHVRQLDLALDHGLHPGPQAAHGQNARAVLVTQGKMEQDVLHGVQAEAFKLFRELGADAFEAGHRQRGNIHKYQYSPQRRKERKGLS